MTAHEPKRWRDLIRLLDAMRDLYADLHSLRQARLSAMRRADVAELARLDEQEAAAANRLQERDGLRKQLMDAIGTELGVASGRTMTVSQLTDRLSADAGHAVRRAADGLRETVHQVAQINRVIGLTAREVISHMNWVFAAVRPQPDRPQGYAPGGAVVTGDSSRIFEIVG